MRIYELNDAAKDPMEHLYKTWLKSAYDYYWGDGENSMSDSAWDALGRQYYKYRHQYSFLEEIDYKSGSMFYVKKEQFQNEFNILGIEY